MLDRSLFWPAFESAGLLTDITVVYAGCNERLPAKVKWREPDAELVLTGMRSKQYQMDYQNDDLPLLAEGDQVLKGGELYRVREASFVLEESPSGFWRRALLTKAC